MSLRALIYCRVSHDPSGRGLSILDQERENRAWCEREGWSVAGVIVDNDSSASRRSKRDRPGYTEVQEKLAAGYADVLVSWESSRNQRDLRIYVQVRDLCEQYRVLWAYKGRVYDLSRPDDRFSTGLDALLDERYADEVHERVMRGVRTRISEGRPHGKIPYGYRREYDRTTGAIVSQLPDPETAPILAEIVRRILDGQGIQTIANDLNRRSVPTPQDTRNARRGVTADRGGWTSSKIRMQLANPTAAGIRSHNGTTVGEANWPAIISAADYHAVQRLLADPHRRTQRGTEPKHLLSGIATCGVCGAACRRIMNRTYPSYACHGRNYDNRSCVVIRQIPVDALVIRTLLGWLGDPDRRRQLHATGDTDTASAEAEATTLRARLEEFIDGATAGGISQATLAQIEAKLRPQIAEAERRAVPRHLPQAVTGLMTAEDLVAHWIAMPVVEQRQVVRELLSVRILPTDRRGAKTFKPTRVVVKWRAETLR